MLFELFFNVVFGKKEFADCEKTCDAGNASERADRIVVVNDNGTGNGNDENLERVCRSEVYEHSYKFKTYEYRKHIFEVIVCGAKIGINSEEL